APPGGSFTFDRAARPGPRSCEFNMTSFHPAGGLAPAQIDHFVRDGFVRIDAAFSPELAAQARETLWRDLPVTAANPASWIQPVIRLGMYAQPPFVAAANTPTLHAAYDQLVGQDRWRAPKAMGTFPVRFPSPDDPGDTGWHI